ncbi:hypothetical protein C5Y96_07775 [Blastopirellula marina]|uniref:Uncharacterized protein n=1 Tax=Blastopirellula marina TaxID=124 RepID=A0A2S8FXZ8_9BACT|nr:MULTISPECIES: hypothetical protein [Pirellulaceae]PQO37048.1 hypothetical protein C5Y96_07775 [Blastopirellula marina]RCS53763.1 hypothetical protein DTL36_07785 [Bremerella cremea]
MFAAMQDHTSPGKSGLPKAHAACALICFAGAVASGLDWPSPAPQHAAVMMPAMVIWGIAVVYQFLLAAGHLRTSILDHQHLFSTSHYERQSDIGWMVANVVVLGVVALFYVQQSDSIPILTGQTTTLVALFVTSLVSLVIWGIRWKITPRKPKAAA